MSDLPLYEIKDIKLAPEGHHKIDWAYRNMPVLRIIEQELKETRPFEGLKISVSVHVEAKTANLALVLREGGADVAGSQQRKPSFYAG